MAQQLINVVQPLINNQYNVVQPLINNQYNVVQPLISACTLDLTAPLPLL